MSTPRKGPAGSPSGAASPSLDAVSAKTRADTARQVRRTVAASRDLEATRDALEEVDRQLVELGRTFLTHEYLGSVEQAVSAYGAAGQPIPPEQLIAFGDRWVDDGEVREEEIIDAYVRAEAPEKLIAYGHRLLARNVPYFAVLAFKAAGYDIEKNDLLACGDRCLAEGNYSEATYVYQHVGATERLLLVGERALEQGHPHAAAEAYAAARTKCPVETFIACGDRMAQAGNLDRAVEAYKLVRASGKLVELGDRCLADVENLHVARCAYEAARRPIPREKLIAAGLLALKDEDPERAHAVFVEAGATDELVMLGDIHLRDGNLEQAHSAYLAAGASGKLIAVADCWLARGNRDTAAELYREAGRRIPKAKLEALGDLYVARAERHAASDAFVAAGSIQKLIEHGFIDEALRLLLERREALTHESNRGLRRQP